MAALAGGGQPGVTGPGVVGSSQDTEEGAGNNSEDEYENAARLQSMDPATVEQVGSYRQLAQHNSNKVEPMLMLPWLHSVNGALRVYSSAWLWR